MSMWLMRPCHKKAGKHRHFLKRCVYAGGEFLMHDRNRIRKSVFQRIYGRRQYQQRRETDGCSKANIGVPVCFGGFAVTYSRHLRSAKKWGLPAQGRNRPVSTGYPRASPGSIVYGLVFPDTSCVFLLCAAQNPDSFLSQVQGGIHIPVFLIPAFTLIDPV